MVECTPINAIYTDLLVVDLHSSLAWFTMTYPLPVASKLPIKTVVTRQLPTNVYSRHVTCMMHMCACVDPYAENHFHVL